MAYPVTASRPCTINQQSPATGCPGLSSSSSATPQNLGMRATVPLVRGAKPGSGTSQSSATSIGTVSSIPPVDSPGSCSAPSVGTPPRVIWRSVAPATSVGQGRVLPETTGGAAPGSCPVLVRASAESTTINQQSPATGCRGLSSSSSATPKKRGTWAAVPLVRGAEPGSGTWQFQRQSSATSIGTASSTPSVDSPGSSAPSVGTPRDSFFPSLGTPGICSPTSVGTRRVIWRSVAPATSVGQGRVLPETTGGAAPGSRRVLVRASAESTTIIQQSPARGCRRLSSNSSGSELLTTHADTEEGASPRGETRQSSTSTRSPQRIHQNEAIPATERHGWSPGLLDSVTHAQHPEIMGGSAQRTGALQSSTPTRRHSLSPIREQSPRPQGLFDSQAPAQHPDIAEKVAVHQETAQRTHPRVEPETEPDCSDEDPTKTVNPRLQESSLSSVEQHTSAPCLHEEWVQGHVFTFVRAASLKSSDGRLPRFQDVNKDWLVRKRISIYDLMEPVKRVELSKDKVAVSHVWHTPEDPDPDGEQARIIRDFLRKQPHIELVWIDWCCLPQGHDKTEEEHASFKQSLEMVNLLYLGLHVTILLDSLFVGRFWTQLEAFLSYQQVGRSGLEPLPNNTSRTTVLLDGLAAQQAKQFKKILLQRWRRVSLDDAIMRLRKRDAQITNHADKDIQIQKLLTLREHLTNIATLDE